MTSLRRGREQKAVSTEQDRVVVILEVVVGAGFIVNKVKFGLGVGVMMVGAGGVDGVDLGLEGGVVAVGGDVVVVGSDVVGLNTLIAIKNCSCFFIDVSLFTIIFKDEINLFWVVNIFTTSS
ncbi:hypothetical protein QVD17_31482 [Tagetes erecta]|uniref:Uncharacterized protein n=1 Tax=Tagetes erecta TaxID=13708 RepID=A0AAD8NNW3_TARER|nr:hypothetical protein QVD17_31482 [Tagetes erecta]